jgi:hypothetical protein
MKSTKAHRTVTITDTATCPYCGADDNENIFYKQKVNNCTMVFSSCNTDLSTINENKNYNFICECWNCDKVFKIDYIKEV